MKKFILLSTFWNLLILGNPCWTYAQGVGVSGNGAIPDGSALLDIDATSMTPKKGLLIPRVTLASITDVATILTPAKSLMVYNTGTGTLSPAGYYYNQGTTVAANWIPFLTDDVNAPSAWSLKGNTGITASVAAIGSTVTAGSHFIGTTDSKDFVFATNNYERMRITSGGYVGVGTIAPSSPLHVVGNSNLASGFFINTNFAGSQTTANTGGYYGMYVNPTYTAASGNTLANLVGGHFNPGNSNTGTISSIYGIACVPRNLAAGTLTNVLNIFSRADNTSTGTMTNIYGLYVAAPVNSGGGTITNKYAMTTEATAGNVGLGTVVPIAGLHTQGAAAVTGTGTISSSGTTVTGTGTSFTTQLNVGDAIIASGQTKLVSAIATATSLTTSTAFSPVISGGTAFTFQQPITRVANSAGTTQMIVNSLGQVGVGDQTPSQALDVNGSIGLNAQLRLKESGNSTYDGTLWMSSSNGDVLLDQNTSNRDIVFRTNTGTLAKMTVDWNGNVGIGTSGSGYKLAVNGQPGANGYTAFTNYSYARLKKNVINISSSLEKIMRLRPVQFNYNEEYLNLYNDSSSLNRVLKGFIAQEVKEIFPEMVGTTKVKGKEYFDLNLSNLQVYMVKAMQEQQKIIEEQQKTINSQESAIKKMEAENKNLKTDTDLRISKLEAVIQKR